jgi:thiamine pyrophosphokinase
MSRIVIFANGVLNQPDFLRAQLRPTDRVFCADGGTRHALALGITPEVIIGDLDSLQSALVTEMEIAGVTLHRHPTDKDQTDLELALELAVAEKPDEIMLVTALEGRLDQMLANLLLMTRPEYASVQLTLADGLQWAALLRDYQSITIDGQPGDTLSLIPLSPIVRGVNLTGVKWPLSDATLFLGSTLTISNSLANQQATVQIDAGMALLVHFDKNHEEDLQK